MRKDNSALYFIMLYPSVLSQYMKGNIRDNMFKHPQNNNQDVNFDGNKRTPTVFFV